MKYEGRWDVAEDMGHIMARECGEAGFFDGIDVIVPIPITKSESGKEVTTRVIIWRSE